MTPQYFFFQAEDGIRYGHVTGVQTCALPIWIGDQEQYAALTAVLARSIGIPARVGMGFEVPEGQEEIGRASCREGVAMSVGGAGRVEKGGEFWSERREQEKYA